MRCRVIIVALLCLVPALVFAQTRVLFVGNSHTMRNDLPGLFTSLAEAAGHAVEVDQSTFGGYTLEEHSVNATTLGKIAAGNWDHVVLQEYSLYPAIDFLRENSSYPAARLLDSLIAESGSGTTFFMTWGRELGGIYCVDGYCTPNFPDYFAMQEVVTAAYVEISLELDAFLVPVGSIWTRALAQDPLAPLWEEDGNHPSPEGSYLSACVFFARIFDENPEGLEFTGGIDPDRALFYQGIAAEVLTDARDAGAPAARLLANHPNPFNPRTSLEFTLAVDSGTALEIFDTAGRIVDCIDLGHLAAGHHRILWDAGNAPSGVYLCRLRAGGFSDARKLTLIR